VFKNSWEVENNVFKKLFAGAILAALGILVPFSNTS